MIFKQKAIPADSVSFTSGNSTITAGAYTYGVKKLHIKQWGEGADCHIGKFCSLAEDITIMLGGNHRTDWISTYPFGHINRVQLGYWKADGHPATRGDVVIGDDVWIGQNATIMSGVTIGSGAVVAACSVVTKDVPPYGIVGGNPAKFIRQRFDDETCALLLELRWWDLPEETVKELAPILSEAPDRAKLREMIETYRS